MQKVLFVIAPQGFKDKEYFTPRQVLLGKGFSVETASLKKGEAISANGKKVFVDLLATEASSQDYEAVVFVGGPGMVELVGRLEFIKLAQAFYKAGKLVAAICVAPAILAKAGLLKGVAATCWEGTIDFLSKKGAVLKPKAVVWAGKIITANGPLAAEEFGETIAEALTRD